jgi:tetratricopeptide (TPR) repeat protein
MHCVSQARPDQDSVPAHHASIRQKDLLALPASEQDRELADFAGRVRLWADRLAAAGGGGPHTVSVEVPVFKGGWVMPCIESVLYQTSTSWSLSIRWDGGDALSRRILEVLQALDHPRIHVYFGENRGIAYNRRFLTEHSGGEFIIPLDDDDMLGLDAVEKFLAAARERPWSGIIRARRDFIDEVGRPVQSDPWFPFEPRHYQYGMVQDVFNHSQPTLISRAAYERTSGWEGFEEFRFAGEDCDLYIKVEEVAPIELLDEVLYFYRISDRRTSLILTDSAAFEMWRRLADAGIARLGLPLKRTNERPPFTYERTERPPADQAAVEVVVFPAGDAAARNDAFARTTKPLVCFIRSGIALAPEALDHLLRVMNEHVADMVGLGGGEPETATASWLSSAVLLVRREVVKAVGGFEPGRGDVIADKDFSLKARQRGFTLVRTRASGLGGQPEAEAASTEDAEWLLAKWIDHDGALVSVDGAGVGYKALYDKGCALASEGRFRDAARVLNWVTKLRPQFSWGHHSLGDALFQLERWESAAAAYRRAIELKADVSWTHHHLGNTFAKLERWQDAVESYRNAIEIEPEVASAHRNLGLALMRLGHFEEAANAFGNAVARDGSDFWSLYGRADAWSGLSRWRDAVDAYEEAIAVRADVAWSHLSLGTALMQLERFDEAVASFRTANSLQGDLGLNELGQALLKLKRWEEALQAFDQALTQAPDQFWPHYGRGDALSGLERWLDAAGSYERAIALQPDVPGPHLNLGTALAKLEQWTAAAAAFRRAIEVEPGSALAHVNLANALTKLDQWAEAVDICERAAGLSADSFWAHQIRGVALLKLRQWERSEAALRRAIELNPDFGWSYHYLGDGLVQQERLEEAAAAFRRATELEPQLYWAHNNLGETLLKLRRPAEAVEACLGAIAARPDLSGAHHNLGDALVKCGRWEEAAAAYERADEITPAWSRRDVGPGVAELEGWLERQASPAVSAHAAPSPGHPKVLFVLDSDYGELTTAMYLLLGQQLAHQTRLLLPPRLHVVNQHSLPGRTAVYQSLDEVLEAVDAYEPAVVVLASGYLFPIHEIFLPDALETLVTALKSRGCRVVTTDPFLGLLSGLGTTTSISIDIPENASPQLVRIKEQQDRRLIENFTRAVAILRGLPHLYPVFPARPDAEPRTDEVDPVSFFNPELLLAERGETPVPAADRSRSGDQPQWVFVLASRDYEVQVIFHGKPWFIELLAGKIEEAVRAGRHAVFIGPYGCVQALIERLAAMNGGAVREGVTLLTFCPFKRFSALLLNAEYVFYWNALSHSMFLRLFNGLPVFLFDQGHLVRNVVPLYERIVDWYYQGWEPIYLDQEQALDPAALAPLAEDYRRAADAMAAPLRRSPPPAALLQRLAAHRPDTLVP